MRRALTKVPKGRPARPILKKKHGFISIKPYEDKRLRSALKNFSVKNQPTLVKPYCFKKFSMDLDDPIVPLFWSTKPLWYDQGYSGDFEENYEEDSDTKPQILAFKPASVDSSTDDFLVTLKKKLVAEIRK